MQWKKEEITLENDETVKAQAPVIISASRSTDIPAFYGDWFVNRHKAGYLKWRNPFNGVPLYITFKKARAYVFWSKNPKNFLKHIDYLNENKLNYSFPN